MISYSTLISLGLALMKGLAIQLPLFLWFLLKTFWWLGFLLLIFKIIISYFEDEKQDGEDEGVGTDTYIDKIR